MLSAVPVKKLSTQRTSLPSAEQPLAKMRAEEPGAARDQDALPFASGKASSPCRRAFWFG